MLNETVYEDDVRARLSSIGKQNVGRILIEAGNLPSIRIRITGQESLHWKLEVPSRLPATGVAAELDTGRNEETGVYGKRCESDCEFKPILPSANFQLEYCRELSGVRMSQLLSTCSVDAKTGQWTAIILGLRPDSDLCNPWQKVLKEFLTDAGPYAIPTVELEPMMLHIRRGGTESARLGSVALVGGLGTATSILINVFRVSYMQTVLYGAFFSSL
ncbi:uncharacterized protein EI90DRAFT_3011376 [Cantharellus anzutake]|uniref:uncharacterized protein n=1 Tax=Cantharellus anzutake TaxID=1750568 RepID=UPI0019087F2F|nr:uncharacterized protein EI90DRAFT_3011376 [Cantharellus anzutake]KAF8342952.1 hypothetical protein EI90DRAFT_3011376 [Cantharellus anzutake]